LEFGFLQILLSKQALSQTFAFVHKVNFVGLMRKLAETERWGKSEIRSSKSETNSNNRNTKFKTKKAQIGSPSAPKLKTKDSLPFLDTDSHWINTVFFATKRRKRDFF